MRDFHMHTTHSHDGISGMEEYIIKAIDEGMRAICFTEHMDFNQVSSGYENYSPKKFFEEFHRMKQKYAGQITICAGIEAGEPHLYGEEIAAVSKYPYDFILGSVHWAGKLYMGSVKEMYTKEEFFHIYWEEVLKAVKHGGFDALAHIDLPGRCYGELYYTEAVMKEIFGYMVDKNIALEINTSSIRKGISRSLLDRELLEIYKDCGGKYITIGSDAHRVQDMAADYSQASRLASECGLQEVVFIDRQMKTIKRENEL